MHKFKKGELFYLLLLFLFFLSFLNLIYLDLKNNSVPLANNQTTKSVSSPLPTAVYDQNICPKSCLSQIYEATTSSKPTLAPPVNTGGGQPQTQAQTVKEYYVSFGSGVGSSSKWQDVPGLQAYVDNNAYGRIKSIVFESSLHVPTGNETVSVRLYNSTDGRAIQNTQLDFNGNSSSVFSASQPITLDYGNKLYKVQMQTQLGYPAVLDQSRIHITTY